MRRDFHIATHQIVAFKNSLGATNSGTGGPAILGNVGVMEDTMTIVKTKKPSEWRVIIHNDDATPIQLVMIVLMTVFSKSENESVAIMTEAEENGLATIGVYSYDIACSLIRNANEIIRSFEAQFNIPVPLRITKEEIPQA